jgi:hypothetical protein
MMAMGLWLAAAARADAGPEDDEQMAPEAMADATAPIASLPQSLRAAGTPVLPVPRPSGSALPVCPDGRGPCRSFCTVAEPGSVLWDGMLDRDISGPPGAWRKKRGRG